MRTSLSLLILGFLFGCTDNLKEITNISKGMNKQEVVTTIGDPSTKKDIEVAELWDYPAYNKTIIFRSDTVYDIIASSSAEADSIKRSFKTLGKGIKTSVKKIGKELDTVRKKLEGKPDKDSNDNKR